MNYLVLYQGKMLSCWFQMIRCEDHEEILWLVGLKKNVSCRFVSQAILGISFVPRIFVQTGMEQGNVGLLKSFGKILH